MRKRRSLSGCAPLLFLFRFGQVFLGLGKCALDVLADGLDDARGLVAEDSDRSKDNSDFLDIKTGETFRR